MEYRLNKMNSEKNCIGIDLGTTFSCVGIWKDGHVDIIANTQGNRTTPSYVGFTEDGIIVGDAAKNQVVINPKNTVYDAKRLIGREYNDPTIQNDKKHYSFEIVNDKNKPYIKIEHGNEIKTYPPEFISSQVLRYMKESAEAYLGFTVKNAVITVPAYFNDQQRNATKDAGAIAGLNVLRIINEPTAAAIAYGLEKVKDEKNVIVFDYGGGTLDVSILNISEGVYQVISTNGDTHMGGEDLDNCIVDYCIKEFKRKHNVDLNINSNDDEQSRNRKIKALRRIKTICERAKITLSSSTKTKIELDSVYNGIDMDIDITRAKFEELCRSIFERIYVPIDNALRDAKLGKNNIDDVVLIGGSSRIPKIQEMLTAYFGGKQLCKSINPDEAVAYGATVQGAILMGIQDEKINEMALLDIIPLTLGVKEGHERMEPIITRNTTMPVRKNKIFSTACDGQTTIAIEVYEGERPLVKDNHFLGRFELSGIPPSRRGEPKITIDFDVDANGILTVTATEEHSKKTNKLTISKQTSTLSREEVERMINESEKYKEEDDRLREKLDKKHEFETLLTEVGRVLTDENISKKISEDDKKKIEEIKNNQKYETMRNTSNFTKEDYEVAKKEIEDAFYPIMSKIYQSEQQPSTQDNVHSQMEEPKEKKSSGPKIEEVD